MDARDCEHYGRHRSWSRCLPATKHDLDKLKQHIDMKASELTGTTDAIKNKIIKIAKEQQDRFDKLSAEIDALKGNLVDADIPEAATTNLTAIDGLLTQLDDTIIDTETQS
jgi:hypothetical protein